MDGLVFQKIICETSKQINNSIHKSMEYSLNSIIKGKIININLLYQNNILIIENDTNKILPNLQNS